MKLHFRPKSDDIELTNEFEKDDTNICNLWYTWNTKFMCLAHVEIWWHDAKFVNKIQNDKQINYYFTKIFLRLGKCVPKVWGGCNETPNNFGTKEACEAKCPPK